MIPLIIILLYLVIVAGVGFVAYQRGKSSTEDFFLASRSIGTLVFFLSLFATNMTAFAILGSSGVAYKRGIGIFGLMASSSGFLIPLTIFFIGTRLWAIGKKFGHMTQVQFFRDRWECAGIGTGIFALSAVMLVPYMIVSLIGGGRVLADISGNLIPYAAGCFIVALVVTLNVFLGGMRGVVWVNIFQTILFTLFGAVAAIIINNNLPEGGFAAVFSKMMTTPAGALLARDRIPAEEFWSYTFIPFSSIMFPHMAIMCLSARKMSAFKNTVIAYPIAIMAVWLPCVFLGVVGAGVIPGLEKSDGILLLLLAKYASPVIAGILGAGIISAVMGSDCHQVLALSTMFTKDVFSFYGGQEKYGEKRSVAFARFFIIVVTVVAYLIALITSEGIFEIAVQFAFSGFAAMAPIMLAALFWKRSTKWGALASTAWVAVCLVLVGGLKTYSDPMAPKPPVARPAAAAGQPGGPGAPAGSPGGSEGGPKMTAGAGGPGAGAPTAGTPGAEGPKMGGPGAGGPKAGGPGAGGPKKPTMVQVFPSLGNLFLRNQTTVTVFGYLPVVPMLFGSALLMILVSLLTPPPSRATIEKYFPPKQTIG